MSECKAEQEGDREQRREREREQSALPGEMTMPHGCEQGTQHAFTSRHSAMRVFPTFLRIRSLLAAILTSFSSNPRQKNLQTASEGRRVAEEALDGIVHVALSEEWRAGVLADVEQSDGCCGQKEALRLRVEALCGKTLAQLTAEDKIKNHSALTASGEGTAQTEGEAGGADGAPKKNSAFMV